MIFKMLGGILLVIVLLVSPVAANETANETVVPERPIRGVPCGANGYVSAVADWGHESVEELNNDTAMFDLEDTNTLLEKMYFFTVFIITLIAGICAAIGNKTLALRLVQLIIVSFLLLYVLPGIIDETWQ